MKTVLATLLLLAVCAASVFGQEEYQPPVGSGGTGNTSACYMYKTNLGLTNDYQQRCVQNHMDDYSYNQRYLVGFGPTYQTAEWVAIDIPFGNWCQDGLGETPTVDETSGCETYPNNRRYLWVKVYQVINGIKYLRNDHHVYGCFGSCISSPILSSFSPGGLADALTSKADGVDFDLNSDGVKERIPWLNGSNAAWLVLDRNGNGLIDNGQELFGNFTPQTVGACDANGFVALAEYDKPLNGGNGDGRITSADSMYAEMRWWLDLNHNGISEGWELLPVTGSLPLDYHVDNRHDRNGNTFRLMSLMTTDSGSTRPVYDVYLNTN